MKITEQSKHEAIQLMQKLNENQWRMILNVTEALIKETTPEKKATDEERQEQNLRELQAKKESLFSASEAIFTSWKEKNLNGVQIPERYELMIPTIQELMDYATRINPDREPIFNGFCAMYSYGFKRGMAYSKSMKKKKAALHAANTKNGLESFTDEI